jgi:hypothetical protein
VANLSDEELLAALGVSAKHTKMAARTPREERVITGFEEIQKFFDERGRRPLHGEDRDIFERLYAVRLDRLRASPECRQLLAHLDRQNLLGAAVDASQGFAETGDDALLAALGVGESGPDDITTLTHVKPVAERRAAEEIASRKPCRDFEKFEPLFLQVQEDLDSGLRRTRPFEKMDDIKRGEFFIVGGQKAYVAEVGEEFITQYDRRDSRLRVIYDNGTESDVLLRSLQRALHRDGAGRRITDPSAGPLFADNVTEGDAESGTIYVLRSRSDIPEIAANRDLIHKIGVTGGKIDVRTANAQLDPTYLLADIEVVATYELFNIERTRLENVIHRFFSSARLDLEIEDRFGNSVRPREWYLVPLAAIDEAVTKIRDGTIVNFMYDTTTASIKPR